jgi:hypothetical protein
MRIALWIPGLALILEGGYPLAGDADIVPKDAKLEKVWGDGEFTEGRRGCSP